MAPYLQRGINYVFMCVMVDFICMVLLKLQGLQSKRELQNEKFLPTVEFKPTLSTALRLEGRLMSYPHDNKIRLKAQFKCRCYITPVLYHFSFHLSFKP